ncbi:MAG: RluA family pseudouridine synthase [Lachnospiraceae bacterium]|nr:RluA family pseudouridine synthase [Lachnospiraceae bacterium]
MSDALFLKVKPEDAGTRLDTYLASAIPDISRSRAAGLLEKGLVTPAQKPGYRVAEGDEFCVEIPEAAPMEALPQDIPLDILYEDSDVIVVNKPKGMVVHPDNTHRDGTLVNALLFHCRDLSGVGGVMRPGIVHRIDMDTTGSVIACKNDAAHESIAAQLKVHSIRRVYVAIAIGSFKEKEGVVDAPIGRSEKDRKRMAVSKPGKGRRAVTHYRVIKEWNGLSLVECRLETGRTHQIRVHMAYLGHPILGDEVYGRSAVNKKYPAAHGQCLHAMVLGFEHPRTGEYVETVAPLPDYFYEIAGSDDLFDGELGTL